MLSAVVVVSLAIGIGVNTAVFSWVQAVVLRPLPGVPDVGRIRLIEPRAETGSYPGVSWQRVRRPARAAALVSRAAGVPHGAVHAGRARPLRANLRPARLRQLLFGAWHAACARPLPASRRGDASRRRTGRRDRRTTSGRRASAAHRRARADTPRQRSSADHRRRRAGGSFRAPCSASISISGCRRRSRPRSRAARASSRTAAMRGYQVMGRLPSRIPLAQAQAELDQAMRDLGRAYPETNATLRAEVLPFWQAPRGPQRMFATMLAILQGILLVLLLAVCGNTANLVLARASTRQREMGVRLALGAGRWRVVSLILAENILLGLIGAALGAAIAVWATDALRAVPLIGAFPIKFQTSLDGVSLAFAMALGVGCGLMFGMAPALQLSRVEPQTALRAGARTAGRSVLAEHVDGRRGRPCARRAAGGRALLAELQRDPRRGPRLQARRRAARQLRFHGDATPARRRRSISRRDCSNGLARCPASMPRRSRRRAARHSRTSAALVHARRPRVERGGAGSGAHQHRHARLLRGRWGSRWWQVPTLPTSGTWRRRRRRL